MKIRQGFVSNSSSSSFMIRLTNLTSAQIICIQNHGEIKNVEEGNIWNIYVEGSYLKGTTFMDNFDMSEFMEEIDVDLEKVKWDSF